LVPDFEQGLSLNFIIMEVSYLPLALIGVIGMGAMQAIGRNPAASNDINAKMLTAIALCEVPGLLAFAALFIIK
jgi:hypothetical protein